jgi:hypothetical protein
MPPLQHEGEPALIQTRSTMRLPGYLFALLAVYCAASLIHFVHNAQFIAAYPNLPPWLTSSEVYLAWIAVTSVGAAGVALALTGQRVTGLVLIAVYAALGFAGLDHYTVAAVSAHTLAMNATIAFEVATAAILLAASLALLIRPLRHSAPSR